MPRGRDPWRDRALRPGCERGRARDRRRDPRDRRPVHLRGARYRGPRAGAGARRRRPRQQGVGGCDGRDRDGAGPPRVAGARRAMIVDRPWGRTQTFALNQPATARLVTVVPGGDTGAHYHRLRDELWIVLDRGLTIEIGNRTLQPEPGDELQVPAEEPHRIRCGPDAPGRVLQIAFGYASEDDRLPVEGAPSGDA